MKTLTLVELAQAIEDGKTIQITNSFGNWVDSRNASRIFGLFDFLPNGVRIKPEPREYWIYNGKVFESVEEWEKYCRAKMPFPRVNPSLDSAVHVREVI